MKSNYKRLGDYIRQIDVRNRDLAVDNLLGLSISKQFIPSIANTIGTDMANYKIVQPRQFGYVPVTSRNGDKITVALYDGNTPCIISQAYIVFEVTDKDKLLPEYLMMWFRRPEFDRYSRFKSHGSAREVFEWEEMCEVMLPVPQIEEQRKIVAEYQAVERRIENNRRLITTLEDAAQTIYRKMFADNIDPNNLPQGWRMGKLGDVVELSQGIQVEVEDQFLDCQPEFNRFIRIIDYTPGTNEPPRYVNIKDKRYFCSENEVSMIRYGDAGKVCRRLSGIIANNLFKISPTESVTNNFIYYYLNDENMQRIIRGSSASSTMPAITHKSIKELDCILPPQDILRFFDNYVNPIEDDIMNRMGEIKSLRTILNLILSKLSKL